MILASFATAIPAIAGGGGGKGNSNFGVVSNTSRNFNSYNSFNHDDTVQDGSAHDIRLNMWKTCTRGSDEGRYDRGIAHLENGEFIKAERALSCTIWSKRTDVISNYLMGLAKAGNGKSQEANKHFERAIQHKQDFIAARRELGRTHASIGAQKKAREQLAWFDNEIGACASDCEKASDLALGRNVILAALNTHE